MRDVFGLSRLWRQKDPCLTLNIRQAVGPDVEVLVDAHGNFNVPTAVSLANSLAPYDIHWFEEPVPPESFEALRAVRESTNIPICMGERHFTRYGSNARHISDLSNIDRNYFVLLGGQDG